MGEPNVWQSFSKLPKAVQLFGWVLLLPFVATLALTRGKFKPAGRLAAGIGVFAVTGALWVASIASFTLSETQTTNQSPDVIETQIAVAEDAEKLSTNADPSANTADSDANEPTETQITVAEDAGKHSANADPSANTADSDANEPVDLVDPNALTEPGTVQTPGKGETTQPRAPPVESADGELVALLLEQLTVATEQPAGYNRELFTHWTTQDGCTTRNIVLIRDANNSARISSGCTVESGSWYSPFDATWFNHPRSLDIDHLVPLAEAWRSGAHNWDHATRRAFANDLSDPRTLIAVSASSNRSKSDRDPANWLPPNKSYRCTYIGAWVAVKHRWQLTIDSQEQTAIRQELNNCGALRTAPLLAARPTQGPPPTPTPSSPPSPSPSPAPAPAPTPATCVDINTASLDALQRIVHIGISRANALVSLRPFSSLADLTRISGIGPARLADIQNQGIACAR